MTDSINSQNNTTLLQDIKSSMLFNTAFVAPKAFGSITNSVRLKKAGLNSELETFKKLKIALKDSKVDSFTKNMKLSQTYEGYTKIAKEAKKMGKFAKKSKLPLAQRFKNLFRKEKVTIETLKDSAAAAQSKLKNATNAIQEGKLLSNSGEILETSAKTLAKSSKTTIKSVFKSELKNKFILIITLLGAVPRIKEEVIPAFKEKGFFGGIKATGKLIARTATDFISNAGFSAIGRVVGTAVGSILPGIGNVIGGMLGDALGTCISMRLTSKIFDKKEKNQTDNDKKENNLKDNVLPEKSPVYTRQSLAGGEITGNKSLDNRIRKSLLA